MLRRLALIGLLTCAVGASGMATADPAPSSNGPRPKVDKVLVIGHRGASGYRPEHTLAAYELATGMDGFFTDNPDLGSMAVDG